jgi:hypothetical protein
MVVPATPVAQTIHFNKHGNTGSIIGLPVLVWELVERFTGVVVLSWYLFFVTTGKKSHVFKEPIFVPYS